MRAVQRRHGRLTRGVLALLLAIQTLGGGAVTLAHAADRQAAPVVIEARHDASCVVLHDPQRCALCQYAGITVATAPTQAPPAAAVVSRVQAPVATTVPHRVVDIWSCSPRAPPVSPS